MGEKNKKAARRSYIQKCFFAHIFRKVEQKLEGNMK